MTFGHGIVDRLAIMRAVYGAFRPRYRGVGSRVGKQTERKSRNRGFSQKQLVAKVKQTVRKPRCSIRSWQRSHHYERITRISRSASPVRKPSLSSKKTCRPVGDPDGAGWRRALTNAVVALTPVSGMTAAVCAAVGVSRATVERRRARLAAPPAIARPRPASARALTAPQQRMVLDLLHTPRFADQAPAEIYATLLDEGVYHCSLRTMYGLCG
jgi:hypothetical protein